jgi:hypothetical protein
MNSHLFVAWTHNNTLLLIETYRKFRHHFRSPTLRKKEVWGHVAAEMNLTLANNSTMFTAALCNKKWSNLELRYKTKKDKVGKTGRGKGEDWPYFQLIDEIIEGISSSTFYLHADLYLQPTELTFWKSHQTEVPIQQLLAMTGEVVLGADMRVTVPSTVQSMVPTPC